MTPDLPVKPTADPLQAAKGIGTWLDGVGSTLGLMSLVANYLSARPKRKRRGKLLRSSATTRRRVRWAYGGFRPNRNRKRRRATLLVLGRHTGSTRRSESTLPDSAQAAIVGAAQRMVQKSLKLPPGSPLAALRPYLGEICKVLGVEWPR